MTPFLYCLAVLVLSSCGYRYSSPGGIADAPTVSVSPIPGDPDGRLCNELTFDLGASGEFVPVRSGGDYTLEVKLLSDAHERIGFGYDRDNPSGSIEKNLLGVEDRRTVKAEVRLVDNRSRKVVVGPCKVEADVDYDYTDPGSPRDLLFESTEPIMPFSLGQLDSEEGAHDDAARPLFQKLAEKITRGLIGKMTDLPE